MRMRGPGTVMALLFETEVAFLDGSLPAGSGLTRILFAIPGRANRGQK